MMNDSDLNADDKMWLDWYAQLKRVVKISISSGTQDALSELNRALEGIRSDPIRSDALAFRSSLWQKLGEYKEAKNDLLEALGLHHSADYRRLVDEESLGLICERLGEKEEAQEWYRKAMRTCVYAEDQISCGLALRSFLQLVSEDSLNVDDNALCASAVERSCRVLGIPTDPSETLAEAADRIIEAQGQPPNRGAGNS